MEDLLKIATNELGVRETPGAEHTERILQYSQESGIEWVQTDETPWCSIFVNWVAMKAGYERSNDALARSWLTVGSKQMKPEPGDIVVFWTGSPDGRQGHVGLFMGYSINNKRIYVLGGNQGDSVSITA